MNLILLIAGIIGGIAGTIALYDKIMVIIHKRITWRKICKGAISIMELIKDKSFTPDIIICGGRAGNILGALISGNLKDYKIPIYSIDFTYKWMDGKRSTSIESPIPPRRWLENKKVLLCVGEVHTSDTLNTLTKLLEDKGVKEIQTAGLFRSGSETTQLNYVAFKISGKRKMPWHIRKNYSKPSFNNK